jgi:hypothetical protein
MKDQLKDLEVLEEASLKAITGGMRFRFYSYFDAVTGTEELGRGSTSYDLPGGARDQAQAKARAQFEALKTAKPAAFQVKGDWQGAALKARILNNAQPAVHKQ